MIWSNIPFYFEVGSSISLWNHPFFVGLSWYPRNFQPTWHVVHPPKKLSCAVGRKKIRAATLRRIRTCETAQSRSSMCSRKWYEESLATKMVSNQILTEHGKITSQAQKKTPRRASSFCFFCTECRFKLDNSHFASSWSFNPWEG